MKFKDILTEDKIPDWEKIDKIFDFNRLKKVPQSEFWHKEGDVYAHTRNVCNKMIEILDNGAPFVHQETLEKYGADSVDRVALVLAALCHDLGKATTTKWDEGVKEWKTKRHGEEGARITRKLFFDEPDIALREKVCWLVRHHMALHHVFDNDEKIQDRLMNLYLGPANMLELCYLNYADSMGSINEDTLKGDGTTVERMERVIAMDSSDAITRNDMNRHYYGYSGSFGNDEAKPTVYVMVGIAGSGKSTWIEKNLKGTVVISRDIAREKLGYVKQGEKAKLGKREEDKVSKFCMERAFNALSAGNDIVIDNMNLFKKWRDGYHKDFIRFKPKYVYVYVEAPNIDANIERRKGQIAKGEIMRMMDSLEFPEPHEYDELVLVKQTN